MIKLSFLSYILVDDNYFCYRFTFPNGQEYSLKFVADENGYQPESSWLPVAPAFPHPIPEFVLEQIARDAIEDANKDSDETRYYQ